MKVDILAIAAHPDDVELASSGILMKHISEGKKVAIVDLTEGELGSRGSVELRYQEAKKASAILGINARENLKMRDGFFRIDEEHILKIVEVIRYYQPAIILANAPEDRHPDHGRASKLVKEAVFYSGLKKIETKRNGKKQEIWRNARLFFYIQEKYLKPDIVIDVTGFEDRKMECIQAYSSQFYDANAKDEVKTVIARKGYLDFVRSRMREMGSIIGVDYAEGLICDKAPKVNSLFDIF